MKVLCTGSGKPGTRGAIQIYPYCPDCGREFGAQGRKAQARLGNPWSAIPRHYTESDRCSKWIQGRQCENFVMPGEPRGRCALHGIGTRDREVAAMRER